MSGLIALLKSKWTKLHEEKASFEGKIVLVTGATGGLGLEAAKKIAVLRPSKLIITARTEKKGQIAKKEIEAYVQQQSRVNGKPDTSIDVQELDMSDFEGVKSFVRRITAAESHLNAAILNAGVTQKGWQKSPNGFEQTIQVNTLSTVLLGQSLLPLLEAGSSSTASHLTFVSSGTATRVSPETVRKHYGQQNVLSSISTEEAFLGGMTLYALSKLLLEYSMRHLAESASGPNKVIVNSCCPGMVKTDLGRQYYENNALLGFLVWLMLTLVGRPVETGARTYVTALTRPKDSQGKLWKNDEYFNGGEMIESEEGKKFGDQMWKEISQVVKVNME